MASAATSLQNRRTGRERRAVADRAVAVELDHALARGEIEVLFQPQYAARDDRLVGAEALARWRRPGPGARLIGGEKLFALAARAGRVTAVSRYLAHAAMIAGSDWPKPLRLSLNVTAADLALADFAEHLRETIAGAGFPAERLTIEITEQSLVDVRGGAIPQLEDLAEAGVRIALDDFGSGFCNFSYLKRLPLHALKLDRSMVDGIAENPRDLAVLRGIVAMAGALGLKVVAEGVENEAQLAVLRAEGCDHYQGFLRAAPLSVERFAAFAAG
ncbi:MAG: EAL domain-containing protein [Novosphingobium sp.]|nr:EAL domain-containing protein [Novosphingobium sp.]